MATMPTIEKRPLLISNGWIQAALIIVLTGFCIMGVLAYYNYTDEPPIPQTVKDTNGKVLFTHADVLAGQRIFLENGLMEYGSIFGHGAYLGPDFTAQYLHRAALSSIQFYGGNAKASAQTIQDFRTNRYNPKTGTLIYTAAQANAFNQATAYYASFFGNPTTKYGLRPDDIRNPEQIRQLTAFFSWSAWAAAADRPGDSHTLIRITGLQSHWWRIISQPTSYCGACFLWRRCWAALVCSLPRSATGTFWDGMGAKSSGCHSARQTR